MMFESEREYDLRPSRPPGERNYVRLALDNMRRSTQAGQRTTQPEEGEASFQLACYREAIRNLYEQRNAVFTSPRQIIMLVGNIIETLHSGSVLRTDLHGLHGDELWPALTRLGEEILLRFNQPDDYDPVETVALIEYRLRYTGRFYSHITPEEDRLVAEAMGVYALMRQGLKLPEYAHLAELHQAAEALPQAKTAREALNELTRGIEDLREDQAFTKWVATFGIQFHRRAAPVVQNPETADPWQVKDSTALDHASTTYDPQNVNHTPEEIDRLREVTGRRPELLVVFRPERMALHETLAFAVTTMKMKDPTQFLLQHIGGEDGIYERKILPRVRAKGLTKQFEDDQRIITAYVDEVMDDHFHIVNPNMEIRDELDRAKHQIMERIRTGDYDPRLVESREALRDLVADDLLRRRYMKTVRAIVDSEMRKYLEEHPDRALPRKPDSKRLAWLTVGGPASGKSTLQNLIFTEYEKLQGATTPLCQVNSDHYKQLLLKKDGTDPEHGARTYWESGMVRQRIIDRLEEMITVDHSAPDFWVSTMVPSPERMQIAGHGAKVSIYVITCPVEGDSGAVNRAHRRALDKTSEDYLRFMSTEDILVNHKRASVQLPQALKAKRRDLRLYDSTTRTVTLIASMDSYNREMRVCDTPAFLKFLKKSFINEHAGGENEVYTGITDAQIAKEFCRYPEAGVSLNLRYGAAIPNPRSESIEQFIQEDVMGIGPLLPISQSECFAWIGHDRAIVRDFPSFVQACGTKAEALLIEISRRWPLTVQDYDGRGLLDVASDRKIMYSDPDILEDSRLRGMLERLTAALSKESR